MLRKGIRQAPSVLRSLVRCSKSYVRPRVYVHRAIVRWTATNSTDSHLPTRAAAVQLPATATSPYFTSDFQYADHTKVASNDIKKACEHLRSAAERFASKTVGLREIIKLEHLAARCFVNFDHWIVPRIENSTDSPSAPSRPEVVVMDRGQGLAYTLFSQLDYFNAWRDWITSSDPKTKIEPITTDGLRLISTERYFVGTDNAADLAALEIDPRAPHATRFSRKFFGVLGYTADSIAQEVLLQEVLLDDVSGIHGDQPASTLADKEELAAVLRTHDSATPHKFAVVVVDDDKSQAGLWVDPATRRLQVFTDPYTLRVTMETLASEGRVPAGSIKRHELSLSAALRAAISLGDESAGGVAVNPRAPFELVIPSEKTKQIVGLLSE